MLHRALFGGEEDDKNVFFTKELVSVPQLHPHLHLQSHPHPHPRMNKYTHINTHINTHLHTTLPFARCTPARTHWLVRPWCPSRPSSPHFSPLTLHRTSLAPHHSPLVNLHSPLINHHSPPTTHHSSFTFCLLPLAIHATPHRFRRCPSSSSVAGSVRATSRSTTHGRSVRRSSSTSPRTRMTRREHVPRATHACPSSTVHCPSSAVRCPLSAVRCPPHGTVRHNTPAAPHGVHKFLRATCPRRAPSVRVSEDSASIGSSPPATRAGVFVFLKPADFGSVEVTSLWRSPLCVEVTSLCESLLSVWRSLLCAAFEQVSLWLGIWQRALLHNGRPPHHHVRSHRSSRRSLWLPRPPIVHKNDAEVDQARKERTGGQTTFQSRAPRCRERRRHFLWRCTLCLGGFLHSAKGGVFHTHGVQLGGERDHEQVVRV